MQVIKEMVIIMVIYYTGLFLSQVIRPIILIPGNIIGMFILFVLLNMGILKVDHIKKVSSFLLKHMGFFFIPLGAAIYVLVDIVQPIWLQIIIVIVLTTVLVMGLTGKSVEWMMKKDKNKEVRQ